MRFIFSLIIVIFFSSANINADDTKPEAFDKLVNDYIEGKTNKLDSTFNNEQLIEFLKKNKISKKQFDLIKKI